MKMKTPEGQAAYGELMETLMKNVADMYAEIDTMCLGLQEKFMLRMQVRNYHLEGTQTSIETGCSVDNVIMSLQGSLALHMMENQS